VVFQSNLACAHAEFPDLGFIFKTGSRYLGGFIGDEAEIDEWMDDKIDHWVEEIKQIALVSKSYPQSTYAGMQQLLQVEWAFVHRLVRCIGSKFYGLQKAIQEEFLPSLFGKLTDDDPVQNLACLPIKHAGIDLPDLIIRALSNFRAS
jgi:hypothetical protein